MSAALQFGDEVKYLTIDVNPFRVDRCTRHMARAIGKFVRSENDYLLLSGAMVLNGLAVTLWLMKFQRCKLLLWNAKEQEYFVREVLRDNIGRLLEQYMFS